jgi:signal peptidase I
VRTFVRGFLIFIGVLAVVGAILRATCMITWTVPEDPILALSIAPTLEGGDTVVLWTVGERGFGELVRCTDPEDPQRFVIGRIVGLTGDTVEVNANGVVSVNGTRYNTSDSCQVSSFELRDDKGNTYTARCSRVEMAGGWHFRANVDGQSADRPVKAEVDAGMLYLLSDNRTLHDDSRDFGALPASSCKEAVIFRLWGKEGFFSTRHRFEYIH